MQIRNVIALKGPNVWANFAVLEATVELGTTRSLPPTSCLVAPIG
jgi:hypothetical protein